MSERPKPGSWDVPFVMVGSLAEFNRIGKTGRVSNRGQSKKAIAESLLKRNRQPTIPTKPAQSCQEIKPPRRKKAEALAGIPPHYIRWLAKDRYPLERPSDERQNRQFLKQLLEVNGELAEAGFDYAMLRSCLQKLDDLYQLFEGDLDLDYTNLVGQHIKKLGLRISKRVLEACSRHIHKFWRLRASSIRRLNHDEDDLESSRQIKIRAFLPRAQTESCLGRLRNTRTSAIGRYSKLQNYFQTAHVQPEWNTTEHKLDVVRLAEEFKRFEQKLTKLNFKHDGYLVWLPEEGETHRPVRLRSKSKKPTRRVTRQQQNEATPFFGRGRKMRKLNVSPTALTRRNRKLADSSSSTHSADS